MSSVSEPDVRAQLDELQDFLQRIERTDTGDLGIDLLLGREIEDESTEGTAYRFGRIVIDTDITEDLEELVREKVDNKYSALEAENLRFSGYSLQNRERDESFLQHVSAESIPHFGHFDRLLEDQRFSSTTYLEPPKPEFQAVRIHDENSEQMAIAFINYTRAQIMGRTSRVRMRLVGDETHREVEDSLLSIPDRIDAVFYDGTMFIFGQSKFEKIFDYLGEYERRADEVVEAIQENEIPFHDFEMFHEAVYGNMRVLRLMHKVHERGAYVAMTVDDADHIRENFDTDVKFEENEDGEMAIKMDDKRDVWAVLRFFNDDHLDSPLTDEKYISLSKQDAN